MKNLLSRSMPLARSLVYGASLIAALVDAVPLHGQGWTRHQTKPAGDAALVALGFPTVAWRIDADSVTRLLAMGGAHPIEGPAPYWFAGTILQRPAKMALSIADGRELTNVSIYWEGSDSATESIALFNSVMTLLDSTSGAPHFLSYRGVPFHGEIRDLPTPGPLSSYFVYWGRGGLDRDPHRMLSLQPDGSVHLLLGPAATALAWARHEDTMEFLLSLPVGYGPPDHPGSVDWSACRSPLPYPTLLDGRQVEITIGADGTVRGVVIQGRSLLGDDPMRDDIAVKQEVTSAVSRMLRSCPVEPGRRGETRVESTIRTELSTRRW